MRGFDCACGEYLEADNDQLLVGKMRQHVDAEHPDQAMKDSQLQRMAEDSAYNVGGPEGSEQADDLF